MKASLVFRLISALLIGPLPAQVARAQGTDEFYRGKSIQLLIGGAPGVSYDFVGRAVARHMGRHIPGNPSFHVENMPGASSLIMTNHFYNRSRRDGTTIGMPNTNVIFEPTLNLLSREGGNIQFDLDKLIWIGTPVQEPQIMVLWRQGPATSLEAMRSTKTVFGSSGTGADNFMLPMLVGRVWGAKIEMVTGYKSPSEIFLAMDRGEVQGVSAALSTLMVNRAQWLRENKIIPLMQFGFERALEFSDLPTAIELAPDPEAAEVLRFIAAKYALARPLALPPDTPPERVRILRDAFDATMKDEAFLADAKKIGLDIKPIDGVTTTKMIQGVQATPPALVARIRTMINP